MVVICNTPACTFGVVIYACFHDMLGWLALHDTLFDCSVLLIHRNSLSWVRWSCTLSCVVDVLVQLQVYQFPLCFSQCFPLALDRNYLVSLMTKMTSISAGRRGLIPFPCGCSSYTNSGYRPRPLSLTDVGTCGPLWSSIFSTSCGVSFPVSLLGCLHLDEITW